MPIVGSIRHVSEKNRYHLTKSTQGDAQHNFKTCLTRKPLSSRTDPTNTTSTKYVRARWGWLPSVVTPLWNAMPASKMNSDVTKYMVSNAFSLNVCRQSHNKQ